MKRILNGVYLVALTATIAACTGSTNPETASLFDNISNLNSGEYDRQIASNRSKAEAIIANNRAAEKRIGSLESQRAEGAKLITALRGEIAAARKTAASARERAGGDPVKIQRVSVLESQISSVEADVKAGNADSASAKAELRRIRSALTSI